MELDTALDQSVALWVTALTRTGDLDVPSRLPGWSVRDLVDHLNGGGLRYRLLVEGHSSDSPPMVASRTADFCEPTPLARFHQEDDALRSAFAAVDPGVMVDHRVAPRSARSLMVLRCFELALHSADLAGSLDPMSDELATYLVDQVPTELAGLLDGGFLGAPGISPTTDPRDELLRLTGRRA